MKKRKRIPEAFHPGEYLKDELKERKWNEYDLCSGCFGLTACQVREILGCRHPITSDIAKEIGEALGTGAEVWLNLQAAYDRQEVLRSARKKK